MAKKKSDDLEFLPGEDVITNTGKKMNVWSSKGTFKLNGNDDKNNTYDKSSYMDVSKFLYEPPIRILFRIIIYSKLKS